HAVVDQLHAGVLGIGEQAVVVVVEHQDVQPGPAEVFLLVQSQWFGQGRRQRRDQGGGQDRTGADGSRTAAWRRHALAPLRLDVNANIGRQGNPAAVQQAAAAGGVTASVAVR